MAKKYSWSGPGALPDLCDTFLAALERATWDTYTDPLSVSGSKKSVSEGERAALETAALAAYEAFSAALDTFAKDSGLKK